MIRGGIAESTNTRCRGIPRRRLLLGLTMSIAVAMSAKAAADFHTLVVGRADDSVILDPAATTRAADFLPICLAYERLVVPEVRAGIPTTHLQGQLAESWSSSEQDTTWIFRLAHGHFFDDRSPVDAAAVKSSFERLLRIGRAPAQVLEMVSSIEAPDGATIVFHLSRPFSAFGQLLTLPMFAIVSPGVRRHSMNNDSGLAWLSEHTAGSGRYHLTKWDRGERMQLESIDGEARPAYFSAVRLEVIQDTLSRVSQLSRGEIDLMLNPPAEWGARLSNTPGVKLLRGASPILHYLELNNSRRPFNDLRLRQAVSLALDRNDIIAGIYGGYARQVGGVLPDGMPDKDPLARPQARDLRTAKRLLAESGFSGHAGALHLAYVPGDAGTDATALAIQAYLAEAGMRVLLDPLSASAFNDRVRFRGDFDLALRVYTADFADPWIVLDPLYNSRNAGAAGNLSRYVNPRADALLNAAAISADPARRAQLYIEAQRVIVNDQPHVVLLSSDALLAYRTDIDGINLNFWQPMLVNAGQMRRVPVTSTR